MSKNCKMEDNVFIRVNGRGNAWPVFVGSDHPFYNSKSSEDLSNASFSVFGINSDEFDPDKILWSVLIDAGNHTTPYILKNENRIPEAVILTHPHMDHTMGVDWIAQSRYHLSKEKYPVYASRPCLEIFKQAYPHLNKVVELKEIKPGAQNSIDEVNGLKVIPFPVFHGESGFGASMLFFEYRNKQKPFLFTGDMLCPLIRKKDYDTIAKARIAFIDSNNRFSYPLSNHMSIVEHLPDSNQMSPYLLDWKKKVKLSHLIMPHANQHFDDITHNYFDEFIKDYDSAEELPHSVFDFANRIHIPQFNLVHYGGFEDKTIYQTDLLSEGELETWTNRQSKKSGLAESSFHVPQVGEVFRLN